MSLQSQNALLDAELKLEDGAAAITASRDGQVGGSDKVIDLGSGADPSDGTGARVNYDILLRVSGIKVSASDEDYDILVLGSDGSDFSGDKIVELARLKLGAQEVMETEVTEDDADGTYELAGTNMRNGTVYRYVKLRVVVAGTSPTITIKAALHPRRF